LTAPDWLTDDGDGALAVRVTARPVALAARLAP
jgi:hypothetical protein